MRKLAFVGLRGSGEPPTEDDLVFMDADEFDDQLFGDYIAQVYNRWDERTSASLKPIGIAYQALPVPGTGGTERHPIVFWHNYVDSIFDGVDKLLATLDSEMSRCPSERFILAGYSQGALAIHIAVRVMSDPTMRNKIAAIALLADPGRVAFGDEDVYMTDDDILYSLGANGIYAKAMFGNNTAADGPLPSWATSKTVSMCHDNDVVCRARLGSWISGHTNYTTSELEFLSDKARAKVS